MGRAVRFLCHNRASTLGASEAPAILGQKVHRFASAHGIWMKKRGIVPDEPVTGPMQRGAIGEGMILQQYASQHPDAKVYPCTQLTVMHPTETWASASPDAIVVGPGGKNVWLAEAKWPSYRMLDEWGDPESPRFEGPERYFLQAQWQMWVAGPAFQRNEVHLPWDIEAWQFRTYTAVRDEDRIRGLVDACRDFWMRCIVGGEAPEWDGSDDADEYLKIKYPAKATGGRDKKLVVDMLEDDAMRQMIVRRRRLELEIDRAVERKAIIDQQIKDVIGECYGLAAQGGKASHYDSSSKSTDWKAIAAAHGISDDEIALHTKRGAFRVLKVTYDKDLDQRIAAGQI